MRERLCVTQLALPLIPRAMYDPKVDISNRPVEYHTKHDRRQDEISIMQTSIETGASIEHLLDRHLLFCAMNFWMKRYNGCLIDSASKCSGYIHFELRVSRQNLRIRS
jgi:hypothetical protein